MGQNHERILLDRKICIRQAFVQLVTVLVDDTAEGDCNVSESNDSIASDTCVLRRFKNLEKQTMMLIAELGADAKEFAKC